MAIARCLYTSHRSSSIPDYGSDSVRIFHYHTNRYPLSFLMMRTRGTGPGGHTRHSDCGLSISSKWRYCISAVCVYADSRSNELVPHEYGRLRGRRLHVPGDIARHIYGASYSTRPYVSPSRGSLRRLDFWAACDGLASLHWLDQLRQMSSIYRLHAVPKVAWVWSIE